MGNLSRDPQFDAGRADGIRAERERIAAILECDEANDRTGLATNLALHTDTDVETAKKLLALAGKEPKSGSSQFTEMMARLENPKIGVDGAWGMDSPLTSGPDSKAIYAARRNAASSAREQGAA